MGNYREIFRLPENKLCKGLIKIEWIGESGLPEKIMTIYKNPVSGCPKRGFLIEKLFYIIVIIR
ncbi:MAG: hypothetical protein IKI11_11190 [Neisseriaceae bacterium]|nr:hypothetical protein [Neisseriaceae bacterium]